MKVATKRTQRGPISLIVVGSLLALGPLWGLLGTVIGMIRAFDTIAKADAGTPERLASTISTSLWSTLAGLLVSPIGVALLAVGIVWLVRLRSQGEASNQQVQPGAGKPGAG